MKTEHVILAIETSGDVASVALWVDGVVVWNREFPEAVKGGAAVAPGVAEALALGHVPTAVAVGAGPGSYTGARIGMTWAKVFAFARGIPLFPIPGPEALARAHADGARRVAVSIPAHTGAVYAAIYDPSSTPPDVIVAPCLMAPAALDDAAGPDAVRVAVPDVRVGAAFVGRVAHEHVLAGRAPASGDAEEPLYLQASAPERKIAP